MGLETERKYLDVRLAALRERLSALGAACAGAHFESNIIYDTPRRRLLREGRLLRLRLMEWPGKSACVMTFKLPAQGCTGVKAREELETAVGSLETAGQILEHLGYRPLARYEKLREGWRLALGQGAAEIDLDHLPFGEVAEIEAPPELINQAARALGLDNFKISSKTYHELNQEWRAANNLPPQMGFEFAPAERQRLRAALGLSS